MKKTLLILLAIIFAINLNTQAEDFSAVYNGDTIYYNITSSTSSLTVQVAFRGYVESSYSNEYSGILSIPDSVQYNGNYYKVTSISGGAFYGCTGLTSITIPNSVTSIGSNAFDDTPYYNNKPDGVVYVNNILYKYKGTMPANTSINIQNGTVSISPAAFIVCTGLTSITIPSTVTSIGNYAFQHCRGLTSITIPNSVTSIGNCAFFDCSKLTSIIIPNSVTSIGASAFDGTPWYNNKPNGIMYINNVLYKYKGTMPANTSINVLSGTISISASAFYDCSGLTSITIPNSVTSIGAVAFSNCTGLTSVTIPNYVTSIDVGTFGGCSGLTSITMPNSITSIGIAAFYNCTGLTSIIIPNSVTSIDYNAFHSCTGLTSISIPNSVTSIGDNSFAYCNSVDSIFCNAIIPPNITSTTFSGMLNNIPICVPCNAIPQYQISPYWNFFSNFQNNDTCIYSITVLSEDTIKGTVTGGGEFPYSTITITATPKQDCVFLEWNDGDTSINRTILVTHDSLFIAKFKRIVTNNINYAICHGDSYKFFNNNLTLPGFYSDTIHLSPTSDSIVNLSLDVVFPPTIELEMVTVDMNNNNVVIWEKNEVVNHYNIYREGNVANQFDLIAIVPYDSASMYVDTNSNPTIKAYIYKISTTDTCLNESELSTFHKTMHLTIGQGMGNNWNLSWTHYVGASYSTYNIYRGINTLDSLQFLTTISSNNTSYTDVNVPSGYVYYQVEIIIDTTQSKAGINSIRSNYATNNTIGINNIQTNNITTKLYPNPTNNKSKLEVEGLNSYADILVYDMIGRVVQKHTIHKGNKELDIDLSGYAKGVYSIRIMNDSINQTKKLIIQ